MALLRPRRFLNTKTSSDDNDHDHTGPDFIVVLAVLICGIVCLLSLIAAARCAWISRFSGRSTRPTTSGPHPHANKGIKKKILRQIPKLTYTSSAEDAKLHDCAICLAEFVAGDVLRVLPQCGHGFHMVCIDMWLRSHSSCPSCRQVLVDTICDKGSELMVTENVENNRAISAV